MVTSTLGDIPARIRECAQKIGSGDALARAAGIPRRTLENYLSGRSEPKASAVLAIAEAAGVSADWLLRGTPGSPGSPTALDEDLLGLLVDGITRIYQEERVTLPPIELGRLAARMHADLLAAYDAPAERKIAIRGMLAQLRRTLRHPADSGSI